MKPFAFLLASLTVLAGSVLSAVPASAARTVPSATFKAASYDLLLKVPQGGSNATLTGRVLHDNCNTPVASLSPVKTWSNRVDSSQLLLQVKLAPSGGKNCRATAKRVTAISQTFSETLLSELTSVEVKSNIGFAFNPTDNTAPVTRFRWDKRHYDKVVTTSGNALTMQQELVPSYLNANAYTGFTYGEDGDIGTFVKSQQSKGEIIYIYKPQDLLQFMGGKLSNQRDLVFYSLATAGNIDYFGSYNHNGVWYICGKDQQTGRKLVFKVNSNGAMEYITTF
jgi:hypothetical protein